MEKTSHLPMKIRTISTVRAVPIHSDRSASNADATVYVLPLGRQKRDEKMNGLKSEPKMIKPFSSWTAFLVQDAQRSTKQQKRWSKKNFNLRTDMRR